MGPGLLSSWIRDARARVSLPQCGQPGGMMKSVLQCCVKSRDATFTLSILRVCMQTKEKLVD
jgi:hypothetical protein